MNLIDIVAILPYFITLATREDEKTLVQADLSEDKDTNKETIQTNSLNLRKFPCLRKFMDRRGIAASRFNTGIGIQFETSSFDVNQSKST